MDTTGAAWGDSDWRVTVTASEGVHPSGALPPKSSAACIRRSEAIDSTSDTDSGLTPVSRRDQ